MDELIQKFNNKIKQGLKRATVVLTAEEMVMIRDALVDSAIDAELPFFSDLLP